ncbi:Rha family transcriptional regulator [Herbaspirillum sp. GCM10030257]|uniref:Rha family transcriptional regulator n=1 Tax=Herbaspirillum sp. GCM10030257 TaxID=3273393 RepID=UPI00360A3BC1
MINLSEHATSLVHLRQGQPITNSLIIADEFGRRHDNVLQSLDSLIADGTLNHLEFKAVKYRDIKGEARRAIELSERGALIAMPFIGGKKSRLGQVRLVDAFLAMRSVLNAGSSSWQAQRKQLAASYRIMSDALHETRADDGKSTQSHHYANEARLLNWVMFGKFEAVDRDHLSLADLSTLEALEARNAIWIARGRSYNERKAALPGFLQSLRNSTAEQIQ